MCFWGFKSFDLIVTRLLISCAASVRVELIRSSSAILDSCGDTAYRFPESEDGPVFINAMLCGRIVTSQAGVQALMFETALLFKCPQECIQNILSFKLHRSYVELFPYVNEPISKSSWPPCEPYPRVDPEIFHSPKITDVGLDFMRINLVTMWLNICRDRYSFIVFIGSNNITATKHRSVHTSSWMWNNMCFNVSYLFIVP